MTLFWKNQKEVCADVVVVLWFVAHLQRTLCIFTQYIWIHFETKNKFMVMGVTTTRQPIEVFGDMTNVGWYVTIQAGDAS